MKLTTFFTRFSSSFVGSLASARFEFAFLKVGFFLLLSFWKNKIETETFNYESLNYEEITIYPLIFDISGWIYGNLSFFVSIFFLVYFTRIFQPLNLIFKQKIVKRKKKTHIYTQLLFIHSYIYVYVCVCAYLSKYKFHVFYLFNFFQHQLIFQWRVSEIVCCNLYLLLFF